MAANLDLSATLRLTDAISKPLSAISQQAKRMQQDMAAAQKSVQQMQSTLDKAAKLTKLGGNLRELQAKIKQVAEAERTLAAAIAATDNPTKRQQASLQRLQNQLAQLNARQASYRAQMSQLGQALQQAGFNTQRFGQSQAQLQSRIARATADIDRQRAALNRLRDTQNALNRAQNQAQNARNKAADMRSSGYGALASGMGLGYALSKPMNEAKRYQTEMTRVASLGLGDKATQDAVKFAKAMKTYGTSTTENLELMRDAMTVFADEHHAEWAAPMLSKMKFANQAMYGNEHGAENEKKFMDMLKVIEMRNGLKSQAAFKEQANIIQQVITATGGRVQAEEWLNTIKTGGVAAKLMDNKAFYYMLEPMVQEMGGHRTGTALMSAYQNLYQGRTTKRALGNLQKFDLIGDRSKVKEDKAGQLAFLDIGAIKNAELFRDNQFAWMEQVLIPAINAKGITEERDVMDAIGSIFSNRTAANLFSQMYMQRAQIHKNARLNEGADNIDALDAKARNTAVGQELDARAKLHDAYLAFGTAVLPAYTGAIQTATQALQGMTAIMERYPNLTRAIGVGLMAIAGGLVVFGTLGITIGTVLMPLITLRLLITNIGILARANLGIFASIGSRLASLAPSISSLANIARGAFAVLRTGLLSIARALIATPIGAAITAIAVAALLIYHYWQPIKAFFSGLWQGFLAGVAPVQTTLMQLWEILSQAFAPLRPVFDMIVAGLQQLAGAFTWLITPAQFTQTQLNASANAGRAFGQVLGSIVSLITQAVAGLVGGLAWALSAVGNAIGTFAAMVVAHGGQAVAYVASLPSRFMAFLAGLPAQMSAMGGQIMDGLRNGIASRVQSVVASIQTAAAQVKSAFAGMMGIHSPSRVFMGYGNNIMQGLHNGLIANQSPVAAILSTSTAMRDALDTSAIRFDSRAPISASLAAQQPVAAAPITINVYATPNQSAQDIAQLVAAEVAKARAPQNTALYDLPETW